MVGIGRSDVWLSRDRGCDQRSGDSVRLELITQDLLAMQGLLALTLQGVLTTLHFGKVLTKFQHRLFVLLIASGAIRLLLAITFPSAVTFLLKLSLQLLCIGSGVKLNLLALLADKAKRGKEVEMRSTTAVVALSAFVTARLSTGEACIHSMSCTNLGAIFGLSLSGRNSLKLLGGMLKLGVLRVYLHLERRNLRLMSRVLPNEFLLGFLNNLDRLSACLMERLSRLITLMHGVSRRVF